MYLMIFISSFFLKQLPHEDMNFDEMILEAAKSITAATAALVRAASAAQRELVVTGRIDGQTNGKC